MSILDKIKDKLRNFKSSHAAVKVELKVIGLIAGDYVNVIAVLSLPPGRGVKDLLAVAVGEGRLEKRALKVIGSLKPPVSVMLNGEKVERKAVGKVKLRDGDEVTVFTPLSGG